MTIHIELLNYILYYALTQLRQKRRPNVNLTVQIRYICALFFSQMYYYVVQYVVMLLDMDCRLSVFCTFCISFNSSELFYILLYIHFYLVEETIVKRNEQSDK